MVTQGWFVMLMHRLKRWSNTNPELGTLTSCVWWGKVITVLSELRVQLLVNPQKTEFCKDLILAHFY